MTHFSVSDVQHNSIPAQAARSQIPSFCWFGQAAPSANLPFLLLGLQFPSRVWRFGAGLCAEGQGSALQQCLSRLPLEGLPALLGLVKHHELAGSRAQDVAPAWLLCCEMLFISRTTCFSVLFFPFL